MTLVASKIGEPVFGPLDMGCHSYAFHYETKLLSVGVKGEFQISKSSAIDQECGLRDLRQHLRPRLELV